MKSSDLEQMSWDALVSLIDELHASDVVDLQLAQAAEQALMEKLIDRFDEMGVQWPEDD